MRVVFMGTPQFVVPVLDSLAVSPEVEVVGVYTTPDRPRGRGRTPEMTPIKARALALGLDVFQPPTLRAAPAQEELAGLRSDVLVVAAYGRLLPPPVLDLPPHGCLNLHPSLLPRHRGPSPVVATILEGDAQTGVTLMLLDAGMDTGPIVAQRDHPIAPRDTAGSLTEALFRQGADLLLESLKPWVEGRLSPQPQDDSRATVTSKLERTHGQADWQVSAVQLERRLRAYTPWPGLFTHWRGQVLKLLEAAARPRPDDCAPEPGLVIALPQDETPVGIVTADGVLGLKALQLEGRRPAGARDFLQGYPQFVGSRLE